MASSRWGRAALVAGAVGCWLGGCGNASSSDGDTENGDTESGGSDGTGATSDATGGKSEEGSDGAGGAVGAGGTEDGAGGQISSAGQMNLPDIEFTYDPTLDIPEEVCANSTISAKPLPLDLYIILDKSGSMRTAQDASDDCDVTFGEPGAPNRWCRAVTALGKYFTSDIATGHRAALQFMNPGKPTDPTPYCGSGSANPHSTPVVELTPLPDSRDGVFVQVLNDAVASGDTDIESALNGIADFTLANQTSGRRIAGLLVTDGGAGGDCNTDYDVLAGIVSDHFQATGIPIYMIGMDGALFDLLELLALGGGAPPHTENCETAPCHYWSVGNGDPSGFETALRSVQEAAVGCAFGVPNSTEGLVNLERVDVRFIADESSTPVTLSRAFDLSDCVDDEYYLVGTGPLATIKLCPTTCAQVGDTTTVEIEILCEGQ